MLYLLLFLSVFIDTFKNIYYNHFSNNVLKSNCDAILFNVVCGIGSVLFFICTGCGFEISKFSMITALIFAAVTAMAQYCSIMSMSTGLMSFSVLFTYLGMLIPTLFGIIVYHQSVSAMQIPGLLLMLVTLYLGAGIKKGGSFNFKWLMFALGSLVMWGLVGVIQQIHQNSAYAGEMNGFLLWSFMFMTLIFAVLYIIMPKTDKNYKLKSTATIPSVISGVIIGAVNLINLYLSGQLPSIVVFPILNGGVIVFSGLAALVLFKEKLTRKQYVGIILGIAAICLLNL